MLDYLMRRESVLDILWFTTIYYIYAVYDSYIHYEQTQYLVSYDAGTEIPISGTLLTNKVVYKGPASIKGPKTANRGPKTANWGPKPKLQFPHLQIYSLPLLLG